MNPTDQWGSAHGCEMPRPGFAVHGFQGRNEIIDALELAVNGSETDVGNFTHLFQLHQHQFPDFSAADFASTALLKLEFQLFHKGFKPGGIQACLFARPVEPMQKFAAAEDFSVSIALDHRDGNGFHALVGGEPKLTVQAFTSPAHTSAAISCP